MIGRVSVPGGQRGFILGSLGPSVRLWETGKSKRKKKVGAKEDFVQPAGKKADWSSAHPG